MSNSKMGITAYVATSLLFLGTGAAIAGAPLVVEGDVPRTTVSYADLDLGSAAGQQALEARVRAAARRLCPRVGKQTLYEMLAQARCFNNALASAEPQITHAISRGATQLASRRAIEVASIK